MSDEFKFSLEDVKELPKRKYLKGSKYDAVIKAFLDSKKKISRIIIPDKDGNYIRTQLSKRQNADVKITVVNGECYLEKV